MASSIKKYAKRKRICFNSVFVAVASLVVSTLPSIAPAASVATNLPQGSLMLVIGPESAPLTPGAVTVTFPVTSANVANGVPIASTNIVQIEMGVRRPGGPDNVTAELRAQVPTSMTGPGTISMNTISWTVSTNPPAGAPYTTLINSGTFSPGAGAGLGGQLIATIATSGGGTFWTGGTLTFSFLNATSPLFAAGNYSATVHYTAWYIP